MGQGSNSCLIWVWSTSLVPQTLGLNQFKDKCRFWIQRQLKCVVGGFNSNNGYFQASTWYSNWPRRLNMGCFHLESWAWGVGRWWVQEHSGDPSGFRRCGEYPESTWNCRRCSEEFHDVLILFTHVYPVASDLAEMVPGIPPSPSVSPVRWAMMCNCFQRSGAVARSGNV